MLKQIQMKKLLLLGSMITLAFFTNAQSVAVNTDGTTAHGSSIFEAKSINKGFLIPRMTSAQRSAIISPALGLLVFDTDTKTIWAYDGTNWKNLNTSGSLTLPYSQGVNLATPGFEVSNQGIGAAIEGSSSAQFGIGMTAKTTGEGSWGLYAFSNGAGSQSIRSYADNGTAFYGENNNPANTNTLMNLFNKGAGKTGSFQLANNSSTSANVQIAGNHLGEQLKIYQTNAANTQAAVSIENSGTGTGVEATSTTGDGVIGTSNTGYGIKGVTNTALGKAGVHGQNNGTAGSGVVGVSHTANTQGVYGNSNNGIGVRGLSSSGTALYGSSTTGYALETNGKIKIAGGNTTPGAGKVLTSDAQGNATWEQPASTPNVAFRVKGVIDGFAELPSNTGVKLQFKTQEYDLSGNYISINENGNLTEANVFYVPFNGIYHFSVSVGFTLKSSSAVSHYDYHRASASLIIIRNGVEMTFNPTFEDHDPGIVAQANGSTDLMLQAGDKVYVQVSQITYDLVTAYVDMPIDDYDFRTFFSGHLVIKL